ncbi:PGN_0703 family putative restriction endonuclease [Desulfurivibrio sp. C05AmB]|uniref:PGN_0703 family putative restriction endonuclease n=1 Tax=Desulfurivibrio sp. C05AmB TaxID=3374371 RepID=UPI00376ECB28
MTYREQQRQKVTSIREAFFKDPGNGIFYGKEREFALSDPIINLWEGIRYDAVDYFKRNNIGWWQSSGDDLPTGHLLSSQIACVNHLYFIRQREDLATTILKSIDPDVVKAVPVDDGYVEFEFIGSEKAKIPFLLNEKSLTRGANCTSVDAAMIGQLRSGAKRLYLIEWKYTESYRAEDKYILERASRYDNLIIAPHSPFVVGINVAALYFEPFYQLMRQTLLGSQCVKVKDYGISSYKHLHVAPMQNTELRERITSNGLNGADIHDAWIKTLKEKDAFIGTTPENLLRPVSDMRDTKSFLHYIENRYWK